MVRTTCRGLGTTLSPSPAMQPVRSATPQHVDAGTSFQTQLDKGVSQSQATCKQPTAQQGKRRSVDATRKSKAHKCSQTKRTVADTRGLSRGLGYSG